MVRAGKGKQLHPRLRRRLSEIGKKLLRDAMVTDSDGNEVDSSIDYSIVSDCGDSSMESELDDSLQWEQQQEETRAEAGNELKGRGKQRKKFTETVIPDDDLEGAIEKLTEKRDTIKVAALEKILELLRADVLSNRVQTMKVTLASHTLGCLKRRAKESCTLALQVLSLVAITLGGNEQKLYNAMLLPVQTIFADSHNDSTRVEAVYALSVACFVCCPDDETKWELLEVLGEYLTAANGAADDGYNGNVFSEALTIAVIKCWAFLASSFHPSILVGKVYNAQSNVHSHVATLARFARNGLLASFRMTACEALALVVQFKYMIAGSWTYSHEPAGSIIGGLDTRIEAYMRESGKSVGKKTRKTQRSVLKDVLETLETGKGPFTELQAGGETLSVSTWSRYFQVHVFRRALHSGFQTHLVKNEVLRDVFEIEKNVNAKIEPGAVVKRRAGLKTKTVHKRNDMYRKDQAQNAFLYDE